MAKTENPPTTSAQMVAEFLGTYFLVLTVGCNVLAGTGMFAVLSIGFCLMVFIYALGKVSGAHFNPAVTLACALCGKTPWITAMYYVLCQLLAGIMGSLTYAVIFRETMNLEPGAGYHWSSAAVVEILFTTMLCFVVLSVACTKANDNNEFYGLAIGLVILAGGYAGGSISGGAFNPAVALAVDVSSAGIGFGWSLAYICFEIIGACLAAGIYRTVHPEEFGSAVVGVEKAISEFVGTFFLMLTVGLNVMTSSPATNISAAAALTSMIYACSSPSGGHLNPAVTLGIFLSGRNKINGRDAGLYILSQTLGALSAALVYAYCTKGAFPIAQGEGFTWKESSVIEIFYTFIIVSVVLHVATLTNVAPTSLYGFAIGSVVLVAMAAGPVSGGIINTAIAFGIDAANAIQKGPGPYFLQTLIYAGYHAAGAVLAAGVFRVIHPQEFKQA